MATAERADVVVIGAGIVGCATAYFLAKRGVKVVICEANTVASGATGLASGGIRTQFATRLETMMTLRTRQLWSAFEREHDIELGYHRIGYLTLASDDKVAEELARRLPMQREVGVDAVELDNKTLASMIPGINVSDLLLAIHTPDDGYGSPADVAAAILAQARSAGVRLRQGARVRRVSGSGPAGFTVHLETEELPCATVVNCGGLGAPEVGASMGLTLPVSAYRQHQFLSEAVDGVDLRRLPNVLDPALDLYLRGEGLGVLLGISDAAEAGRTDLSVTWSLLEPLGARLEHRWPQLLDVGIAQGWVGCYEVTPDRRALIGGEDGFFYAAGFSGHGFMHSFAAGETVAALVSGEAPALDVSELSAHRFDAERLPV